MSFYNYDLQNKIRNLRFIIYLRKSSRDSEDKQMRSIERQADDIDDLIKKFNIKQLNIVNVIKEDASAFETGRIGFNEMLGLIKGKEANAVLVWHPNRISRNYKDGGEFVQLMSDKLLDTVITTFTVFENNPRDKAYLMQEFTKATEDSDNKGLAVISGNKRKLKEGYIPSGRLPEGYIHFKDSSGKMINGSDPQRYPLLKKAIQLILARTHTPMEALGKLNNDWGYRTYKTRRMGGNPLARTTWYKMLSRPFSYGDLSERKSAQPGQRALLEPLVTQDEFNRLQIILGGKGRHSNTKHNIPFKDVLKCGGCGGSITAEEKWQIICPKCKTKFHKGKKITKCPECNTLIEDMKNHKILHYVYLHCTKKVHPNCTQKSISLSSLEEAADSELEKFEIPGKFREWAIKYLNELNDTETGDREAIRDNLEGVKNNCVKKLDSLLKLKISPQNIDGSSISEEEYNSQRQAILEEKSSVERQLTGVDKRINKWHKLAVDTFNFSCYARYWFAHGDVKTKTQILSALGSNLVIKDKNLHVDGGRQFFLVEKGMRKAEKIAEEFEPGVELEMITNNKALEALRSCWLPGMDSNHH